MRVRLRYVELGPIRFLGHRDLARCWERAIRRAGLPIAYSEGFSPRPKMHFGLALSVGHESDAEYLDLDLTEPVVVSSLPSLLSPLLPAGVDVDAAIEVEFNADALQAIVDEVTWHIEPEGVDAVDLSARARALLGRDTVMAVLERKGKQVTEDIRPAMIDLAVESGGHCGGPTLIVDLATRPRSIRPAELLAQFDPPIAPRRVRRHEQWITTDGIRRPPLVASDSPRPAAAPLAS